MSQVRGGSVWPIVVVALVGGLGFRAAFAVSRGHVEALRILRAVPRASLAAPREGMAVYAGVVVGPAGRVDWDGAPSAAYWWWGVERVNKNTSKTVCFKRDIEGMRLREGQREVALAMFDGGASLTLFGRDRETKVEDPLIVDLAGEPYTSQRTFPALAAYCATPRRTFIGRTIPQGEEAEVVACHRGGALTACDGPVGAVLALNNLGKHRARRAFAAATPFLWASIVTLPFFIALLVRAFVFKKRMLATLVPGERA